MTQEQMTEKLLVTRQSVSNWENNKNLPDLETIIIIARTFDVSLDLLVFGGEKNMSHDLNNNERKNNTKKQTLLISSLVLLLIGIGMIIINALMHGGELNNQGFVQETWFLPLGMIFVVLSFIVLIVARIIKK